MRDEAFLDQGVAGLTTLQTLRAMDSGPRGLVESEAEERLARWGENVAPAWRGTSRSRLFVRGLRDPFTAVLLCLGVASASVAYWGTACVTVLLVLVSCALRAAGEYRADRSMVALRELVATTTTVLRRADAEGPPAAREVPVGQLVPGDVIRIGPGDVVPADVRLLRAGGLRVQQAFFTGESAPLAKHPVDVPRAVGPELFAQAQVCFQGSSVASGSGTAVVLATGARTRFASVRREPGRRERSAFDRTVHGVAWALIRFMLITPPLVLMAGAALRGRGLETLPFAVAVAVALTPETLPVIVTTSLARGAAFLARTHGVIVRRLPALHDIGAVDVLCLDKTGTLTQDRPVFDRALDASGRDDPEVLHWAAVNAWWTLQLAELPAPDALDEAVLDAADDDAPLRYDGVSADPFDPVRRVATAVVAEPGRLGTRTVIVKGSVEHVLERCVLDGEERERLLGLAAREAGRGLRLLAVARAERPVARRDRTPADPRGLTFLGLLTFRDALTPSAAEALAVLAGRGVEVKVLTGDHPGTAARVCRELGLEPGDVLTADRIDTLLDDELAALADRTRVFARCTPEHKARVVGALRGVGHTTGFLGDGVNDLPALHAADVGICPRDAVDVARERADVVLAEKDLTAIDHAIGAGRHSSGNVASYLRATLSSNLGNVIAMLVAGLLLPFLPMLPAQVLIQNLCFDSAQLAFAYDRPDASVLHRPTVLRPRRLLRFVTGFGLLNAVADLATFAVLVLTVPDTLGMQGADTFHSGWFTENLLTQALVMVLLRTGLRGFGRRRLGPVGAAAAVLALIGVLLPLTPLGTALGMVALPSLYYLLLAAVLCLYAVGLAVARDRYEQRDAERGGGR
ncbi:Magnesium-transporting ATPase, P-type 1 [Streptomyces sp. YIM 130001]|uniref:magnesium-translocating P-type ATPase n=1 Tax=Streptomyces sp. YIM 130001 TaxID=2259644 RepID=UPI000E65BB1B|nr:magnesium-translocating P-type ATPase [Streptomyces sp. YIM 130001]RII20466.1 Magnesium-transporting ATPase, P-type 1 [Streptomyces sp. YIM 130001]